MEKLTIVVTGANRLPRTVLKTLKRFYNVISVNSAEDLSRKIARATYFFFGGDDPLSVEILKQARILQGILFLGYSPQESLFPNDSVEYCHSHNIFIETTGGGARSVARSVMDVVKNPWTILSILGRRFQWAQTDNVKKIARTFKVAVIGGTGNIGTMVTECLWKTGWFSGLIYQGSKPNENLKKLGIPFTASLPEAVLEADIVLIHRKYVLGVTEIPAEVFLTMNQGGLLVNFADAQLVPDAAGLLTALIAKNLRLIADPGYLEGDSFESLADAKNLTPYEQAQKDLTNSGRIDNTLHKAAMMYPRLTYREYGEGLLRAFGKRGLIVP